jgi:hypothetical protein
VFVGNILGEKHKGKSVLEVRNKIFAGERLEVLRPDGSLGQTVMPKPLVTTVNQKLDEANNTKFVLLDEEFEKYTVFRRVTPNLLR